MRSAWPRLALSNEPVWLAAVGKAAYPMARAAVQLVGEALKRGLVIGPVLEPMPQSIEVRVGRHPIPSEESLAAGHALLALARQVNAGEQLVLLLSGGASALAVAPVKSINLRDKIETTRTLLMSGADITDVNTVRKHLSQIKGGRLGAEVQGTCHTIAISDIVGDDLSAIGSGPTVADATTYADALAVLDRAGGTEKFPFTVVQHLRRGARGAVSETPKPGDTRLAAHSAIVAGGRHDAMNAAARRAGELGYHCVVLERAVTGDVRQAASAYVAEVKHIAAKTLKPLCVISSGETTVHVTGTGRGGRNQEFVLALAADLAAIAGDTICASVGTDGIDGVTTAAGARADATSTTRAAAAGLPPIAEFQRRNDAFHFFEALGDLIETGPTGTNVGDLQIFLTR